MFQQSQLFQLQIKMAKEIFPKSQLPIRKTVDLLPKIFQTDANAKFMGGVVDPLVQPGVLEKTVGYVGRRYGKTYNSKDVYLDTDNTLRSRYQLEPAVIIKKDNVITDFYDYLDLKNQLKFFGNNEERDDATVSQDHYSWNPPIDWDKFVNYREYFWLPDGPPPVKVYGQIQVVTSTYKVSLGVTSTWIFTPDGLTNNPTLTLYRGQTYKFKVNAPGNGFFIRTQIDTGSLNYDPNLPYAKNQIVVYGGKLYKALQNITAQVNPIPLDEDTANWQFVEVITEDSYLNYDNGVENNGTEFGTVTFTVPYDSPDVLFYQSFTDPNRFGRFLIAPIEENTKIDVEKEIIGKEAYASSNDVEFTNGMVVRFEGQVTPEKYSRDSWVVEGVGSQITLTRFQDLIVSPVLTKNAPEILFDNGGFDSQPFDDASAYPVDKDYITISKASIDGNPWSRYNRWFHRSVIEKSHELNQSNFDSPETLRAKRPIIEFKANLQLFNHGSVLKPIVDYIDTFTTDVFSTIEGSTGYIVDGESLFEGARILVVADRDPLANNQIYIVKFITHNNRRQISLVRSEDSDSNAGECVLIRRGVNNIGLMYHFTGTNWVISQTKTAVNQEPLFDLFDENGISFADLTEYPVSTFVGTELVSYKKDNGVVDAELGFSLSYLNIDNVGDIQFEFDLDQNTFTYQQDQLTVKVKESVGFYRFNPFNKYDNGWIKLDSRFVQPIIDSVIVTEETSSITSNAVNWRQVNDSDIDKLLFYVNAKQIKDSYTRVNETFTFNRVFQPGDTVCLKLFSSVEPDQGYYEIPLGLEKNPLNQEIKSFTLGQAADHVSTALELVDEFTGSYPGVNNLRDLDGYQTFSKRFLKHSGLAPLSFVLLCDKEINIIKSLQYAKKSYTEFKNTFITLAQTLYYDQNPIDFVDVILEEMSRSKNSTNAFFGSDMIGNGAYTALNYLVEDEGIKTFALSEKFDLNTISARSVYVYVNDQQLLVNKDYEFNSTFGFIVLKVNLTEGDRIQIREYVSTANNFIPPTPTKLGLYKKYTPMKFLDDTYLDPREMIQGHDGSLTTAYGDYRDDVLLELEYRIYNNIKQEYDESIFNNDNIFGGYYGSSLYNKEQLDRIVAPEFLKWVSTANVDYITNQYLDTENAFTYTYSNMTDPTGAQNLPGYWRGVYQWFYDTDRPHRCPWEMLGFSQQPDWWEDEYGAAPYTRNNLILWEDLRDGIVRHGPRAGVYDRYKRPSLMDHIPVDGDGKLLDPLNSGLAGNFVLTNNKGNFKLGDVSPAEYAWRSSSEWPFAITVALCLMKPFEFISDKFNRSSMYVNILGQTVSDNTKLFTTIDDLIFDSSTSGLVVYLNDYLKSKAYPLSLLSDTVKRIDVALSNRISGFVDQQQQRYLLDSKNPRATSSSVFIPQENFDIIFNVSAPISSIAYSGVVVEKTSTGWILSGYDSLNPFFNYYSVVPSQSDPLITVGGVSENFLDWTPDKYYANGVLVRENGQFYRSLAGHTSGSTFDIKLWKKLPSAPVIGGVSALKRNNFNKLKVRTLTYGQSFTRIQDVVDFLLGYEEYLKSIGIIFEGYDAETQSAYDWFTAAKEFMFWSKHNWNVGSLLTLSPAAQKIEIVIPVGVADSLLDSFYDYQVLKADGTPLAPNFINVLRSFQSLTVNTTNTGDGIYFFKTYFVLKEHVVVFNDRTVFNDVIYDKPTGYRQDRIKVRGFRTVDWDGDYTSPGFLFDNVDIKVWQPFTDYKLGDIVAYKSYYWTSIVNQLGTEEFSTESWTRLDQLPKKGLVSNFDYKISQFEDYYDVDSDGVGSSQRELARHAIGYQSREYLQNLAEDEVTQFRLYQGFIREKGTSNAVVKVFDKLSRVEEDSVVLKEEWAFKVGQFGGIDQNREYEFRLRKDDFKINPQPILLVANKPSSIVEDQHLRVPASDFTIAPIPFTTNINPVKEFDSPSRNAGYVNFSQIDFIVNNRDQMLDVNIDFVNDNDHFWVTFDDSSWTVLRYNEAPSLRIIGFETDNTLNLVTFTFNQSHNLAVNDIIGIRNVANLTGFYEVIEIPTPTSLVVSSAFSSSEPEIADSTFALIGLFTTVRYADIDELDTKQVALLKEGSKLWIDNNGEGKWQVLEKVRQYIDVDINDYGVSSPLGMGSAVLYLDSLKQVITSMPGSGYLIVYNDRISTNTTNPVLGRKQVIPPPDIIKDEVAGVFGQVLAISPDHKYLAVGSPLASNIRTRYKGDFAAINYSAGDIVLYNGMLWEAVRNIDDSDYSSINFNSQDWKPSPVVSPSVFGDNVGYTNQGVVTLYEYVKQEWVPVKTIVSPFQTAGEKFGSAIAIGVSGTSYYLAVSAVGALTDAGRVYLFKKTNDEWTQIEQHLYDLNKDYPENDLFGASVAMSRDGSILVIGAPYSDNSVGMIVDNPSGKAFVYQRDELGVYNLLQTIAPQTLADINDTGITEQISSGDQFGFAVDIDWAGSTLVISSPQADVAYQNQGSVYVFNDTNDSTVAEFRLVQKLESYERITNQYFGSSVSISEGTEKIVVGAKNASYRQMTGFEFGTTFDFRSTTFSDPLGYTGQAYVFEKLDNEYFLAEKLETDFTSNESFGASIDCSRSVVVVGSPTYKVDDVIAGRIRLFKKDANSTSLNVNAQQKDLIDLESLNNVSLYDDKLNIKIRDIDVVDYYKLKILSVAEQELKFKTVYDPAIYMIGTDEQIIDEDQAWFEKNKGKLWWDLSAVKFLDYEQLDLAYRIGNWNGLAQGSLIDVYEWVESPLLPSEWSAVADTVEGLNAGVSGQPKHPDDSVYNVKEITNPATGETTGNLYYYWVRAKTTLPSDPSRKLSASSVAALIENPIGSTIPFIAIIDQDKFLAYNFASAFTSDSALLNIQYKKNDVRSNPVHNEYQLLTEGVADSLPTLSLETKWIDSLIGVDQEGNRIPDTNLPAKQKYGIAYRPRQTMFVDRVTALKIAIDNVNSILRTRPFVDLIDFKNLDKSDPIPGEELNEYDVAVDVYEDLEQVGTVRVKQAVLEANIVNGRIDTIDIIDPGFGYRTVPYIEIEGTGTGAKASITLDNQGRVSSVTITNKGKKYDYALVKIRPFSVLVRNDRTADNLWSIYAWEQTRRLFYRRKSQAYNVPRFLEYINWWQEGFDDLSKIVKEVDSLYQEQTIVVEVGELIRVKEFASGGWAVLEKTVEGEGDILNNYRLVGRQLGTIQIKDTIYNPRAGIGFDNVASYDATLYDLQNSLELRIIFQAVKEDIFIDDLSVEWNKLFFSSIRYAFSEQLYIDWAFKTSFLNAIHNVGPLVQKVSYKADSLESYRQYLEEVKPYRTSIREYTSRYTQIDNTQSAMTDFDLPPAYSIRDGKILPISGTYNRFDEYPWKWWTDNNGYEIVNIELADPGADYTAPPTVVITGNGTGASAQAYIVDGKVSGVRLISGGSGYTTTPVVSLVGGNGASTRTARAVAILGNSAVRTFDTTIKFDRISKNGIYEDFDYTEIFVASGTQSVFDLSYMPTQDKNKISALKNGQVLLKNEYEINLYKSSTDLYTVYRGKLTLLTPPTSGDVITVTYEKNDELLDSVNRIQKYYAPTSGMKGNELPQLMTGIDFGGVQVQGTTFDVTGGWDALPWFTDNWDSVEPSSDYYYVADGSTTAIQLPYVPADGEQITIYIKRNGEASATRIDDLYFDVYDGSTVQPNGRVEAQPNALLPTFVGNGTSATVEIQGYLNTDVGDTLIFRKVDSDGTVTISDVNLIDTQISGGSLSAINNAYVTATGRTPEEIVLDGEKFISPDQVPATEENVPGQVLDSISIKVFNEAQTGATPIQNKVVVSNGVTKDIGIGLTVFEVNSVMVYVDKVKQVYIDDYTIDFRANQIRFVTAPEQGLLIEIISIGIGGTALIDYQEFVADGDTNLFLTKAVYQQTGDVVVSVDGVIVDTGFINSSSVIDTADRTMIQFGIKPERNQVVKIVCIGLGGVDVDALVRINRQTISFDGSTRTFELDNFVNLTNISAVSSILVEVNQQQLKGVDTVYQVYDGTNNEIPVGVDPAEPLGTITSANVKVYVNDELKTFVLDYTFSNNLVVIPAETLNLEDKIRIVVDVRAEYTIDEQSITIDSEVTLEPNDIIEITWFGDYSAMDIITDQFAGGQLNYKLARKPLAADYMWVYKNGNRLTKDEDYSVSVARGVVYLNNETTPDDNLKIVQFSRDIYQLPKVYEIFKDMLNVYHFKRYSRDSRIKLAAPLNYYDLTMTVTDASTLFVPQASRNLPGVVTINGERIEYLTKNGNVLGRLRRGSLGTAIAEVHAEGSYVIDSGPSETIPYRETQEKFNFVSDGSTLLIGPLSFVPKKSTTPRSSWYVDSIPEEYGPCDNAEVFAGGRRLRKDPITVYAETLGMTSPVADTQVEAEFSADGVTPYIRLTTAMPAGTRITVIVKQGNVWYEPGSNTATTGVTLLRNDTVIANFLEQKSSELPE